MSSKQIESTLHENRVFAPPADLAERLGPLQVGSMEEYHERYKRSIDDPEGYWSEIASELHWFTPWKKTLEWTAPDAKWFVGGTTNLCYNCVDRQVESGNGDDVAIIWEGEPIEKAARPRPARLPTATCGARPASSPTSLTLLGVKKGDVVTIYMPMVPELAIAMLACVRIGAAHSIIFGGFSANSNRRSRARRKVESHHHRRRRLAPRQDRAAQGQRRRARDDRSDDDVESSSSLNRQRRRSHEKRDGDHDWWHDHGFVAERRLPLRADGFRRPALLLYTSGSTGKPKGIVHTTGGYMVYTYLTPRSTTFDLIPRRARCTGARRTSGGSPGTPTSSTGCCRAACRR